MSQSRKRPDHWAKKAKKEGYGARSVYKLDEIDRRFRVVPKGRGIALDLGCAPGSWSRFLREKMGRRATIVGVDLKDVADYPGVFVRGSFHDIGEDRFRELLGGAANLIVSDMAPNTTGARFTDHVRQLELAEGAHDPQRQVEVGVGAHADPVEVLHGEHKSLVHHV